MSAHILDHPVWNTLITRHAKFSVGGDRARRFAPDVSPLAAARDDAPASLAALADLVPPEGTIVLLQARPIVVPPGTIAVTTAFGVQMIAKRLAPAKVDERIVRLTDADAPEMLRLATLTKPGPFEIRTPGLGDFFGIKLRGALVAMAGERMKQEGYTEISGICTHPDSRGLGLARTLSAAVAARVVARGETPYLHAYTDNTAAIRLYESLGFQVRCPVQVAVLARACAATIL